MTTLVQVIIPIVSASLADQSQLVRVVILKPLARQMFHILSRTLGELTNRRIFYLPLDRSLKLTPELVQGINTLFTECARVGGILLCQPEHILSFKLMALEACQATPRPRSQSISYQFNYGWRLTQGIFLMRATKY